LEWYCVFVRRVALTPTLASEVLWEDAVTRQRHGESICLVLHVRPGEGAEVLDQLLTASIEFLVEFVDLGLGVGIAAPPLTLGAAELDVPVPVALLVPVGGLNQDRIAAGAGVHALGGLGAV
jgi:hypothetical protein